jgi:propanol-preferring alcohol dehydrogenase
MGMNSAPLVRKSVPDPEPAAGEVRVRVQACGVCHTELDEIEGRVHIPQFPVIPGHEIVGSVDALGAGAKRFAVGDRVGIGWIHDACGTCDYCRSGRENLCPLFRATGRDADGGYAELTVVPEGYAYPIPDRFDSDRAAPLLCAGGVGYRALKLSGIGDRQRLGFTGFGASGHLIAQLARHAYPEAELYVFARSESQRRQALELGAQWTGGIEDTPPAKLHAVVDTTPVWTPVLQGLRHLLPGGRLVINAIGKRDTDRAVLERLDYQRHLWLEKEIKTVANVTASDIEEMLRLAARVPIEPQVTRYAFDRANPALDDLYAGGGTGAKVLVME